MLRKFEILQEEQIENLHEKSVYILVKYGIQMDNDRALEVFRRHGAAVDGKTVYIPERLVAQALKSVPREFRIEAADPEKAIVVGGGKAALAPCGMPTQIIEGKGARRRAEENDLDRFLMLAQTSRQCDMIYPGIVSPLYPNKTEEWISFRQTYLALSRSDKPLLGHSQNLKCSQATLEMASAATGKTSGFYALGNVNSVSPMQWQRDMLDSLMYFAEMGQPAIIMSCPMAGMTGHMFPENTLLMCNVEILAGIVLSQLVREGVPVVYGPHAYMADMRYMNVVIGAAESTRLYVAAAQIAKYYQIPCMAGGALSDAKDFDVQMGIESTSNIFLNLLCGIDVGFQFFGILDNYNSISYEKWIADEEIIERYKILEKPMNSVSTEYADLIGQMGPEAVYAADEDTAETYREYVRDMNISTHMNYESWERANVSCREMAVQKWQDRIDRYKAPVCNQDLERIARKYECV